MVIQTQVDVTSLVPQLKWFYEQTINRKLDRAREKQCLDSVYYHARNLRHDVYIPGVPVEIKEMFFNLEKQLGLVSEPKPCAANDNDIVDHLVTYRAPRRLNSNPTDIVLGRVLCEGPRMCPCCLENFMSMVKTKCGHLFCDSCMRLSLTANSVCPLCRASLQ